MNDESFSWSVTISSDNDVVAWVAKAGDWDELFMIVPRILVARAPKLGGPLNPKTVSAFDMHARTIL
jgi:hypothetical protein